MTKLDYVVKHHNGCNAFVTQSEREARSFAKKLDGSYKPVSPTQARSIQRRIEQRSELERRILRYGNLDFSIAPEFLVCN